MNKLVLMIALVAACSSAGANELKADAVDESATSSKAVKSAPIERIVRQGRRCYKETTVEKMVEACADGRIYYTSISETSRVAIKCPSRRGVK